MPTYRSCAAARAAAGRPRQGSFAVALGLAAMLLAGCGAATPPTTAGRLAPTGAAASRPTAKDAQALDEAVAQLTDVLLTSADLPLGSRRTLVVDPLIDRATGAETAATRSAGAGIARQVRERHPQFQLRPFSVASLAEQPLAVLGSIAGVAGPGSTTPPPTAGQPRVYRLWAVLADLRTNRVLGREMVWVRAEDVDQTPARFFRDSPAWTPDPVAAAYIRTCSSTAGSPIDPVYLRAVKAQAMIANAESAYEAGRYQEASRQFGDALQQPGGEQLRALNGAYLTEWGLGRRREAEAAFGRLVDHGLAQGQLAVKFLFRPGSTAFWADPAISGPYPMWLRQVASKADERSACLAVNGHTSTTGTALGNDRLSLARAERMRARITDLRPALHDRLRAEGLGSRQTIVGTGTDDASDALDRRVEFRPLPCAVAGISPARLAASGSR